MKYTINVIYNEKGKELTSKDEHVLYLDTPVSFTNESITKYIYDKVPQELIQDFNYRYSSDFENLKTGDFLWLDYTEKITKYHNIIHKEIVKFSNVSSNGRYFTIKGYAIKFNIEDGICWYKNGEVKATVTIPTTEQIDEYNMNLKRQEIIKEIEKFVENGYLGSLSLSELGNILDIINGDV